MKDSRLTEIGINKLVKVDKEANLIHLPSHRLLQPTLYQFFSSQGNLKEYLFVSLHQMKLAQV